MNAYQERLDSALQKKTQGAWVEIIKVFKEWPDGPGKDEAFEATRARISGMKWPAKRRKLTLTRASFPHPCWSMAGQVELKLNHFKDILHIPPCSERIESLKIVSNGRGNLERIVGMEHLKNLRDLSLQVGPGFLGFEGLEKLQKLETVEIQGSDLETGNVLDLASLSGSRERLKRLTMVLRDYRQDNEVARVQNMDALGSLEHLEFLSIQGNISLPEDPNIWGRLQKLQRLHLTCCHTLEDATRLSCLENLAHLDLYACRNLKTVHGVETLQKLSYARVYACDLVEDLSPFHKCASLGSMVLKGKALRFPLPDRELSPGYGREKTQAYLQQYLGC